MQYPDIHIAVVHDREDDLARRCLASLAELDYPDNSIAITLLDNRTQEGGLAFVASEFPNVHLLVNRERTWSWIPALAGSTRAPDLLAIISTEVTAGKDLFNELVASLGDNESVAAVKGRVVYRDADGEQAGPEELEAVEGVPVPILYKYGVLKDLLSAEENRSSRMEDLDLVGLLARNNIGVVDSQGGIACTHPGAHDGESELLQEDKKEGVAEVTNEYAGGPGENPPPRVVSTLLEEGRSGLTSVVSDIVWKMESKEDAALLNAVLPGVFDGMQKVLAMERDYLSSKLEILQQEIENKDAYLEEQRETSKTLTKTIDLIRLTNEENARGLSEKSTEIDHLKKRLAEEEEERDREYSRLCEREKLIREKDRMVKFMEEELRSSQNQAREKAEEADALSIQISAIYSSRTYRFLAKPLWTVLKSINPITGNKLFFSMAALFGILILVATLFLLMGIEWRLLTERIADFGMNLCSPK